MRTLMTTQYQNFYREQIQKEMFTRLAWKSRYSKDYPPCFSPRSKAPRDPTRLPSHPRTVLPLVTKTSEKQRDTPLPPQPSPPSLHVGAKERLGVAPLMRPVSPQTRQAIYHAPPDHRGKGRSLYLHRRSQKRPEEKFDYPILSSWEYGWRLGDYSLDYTSPSHGRSCVVKNTFYARNGVFNFPSATDILG
ncbi:protein ATP6V1FNB [Lampris incognitus]|uniref:protein ATP6V1FNB n=1 Tax=Lampris incognitus TaxID=2546036 RepID=UPI0024B5A946|nr:protein ATP6V1FNB [Lampris incognitus]